jgi:hypothetical protein
MFKYSITLRVGKLKHPINEPGFVERRVMHYPENKVAALIAIDISNLAPVSQ